MRALCVSLTRSASLQALLSLSVRSVSSPKLRTAAAVALVNLSSDAAIAQDLAQARLSFAVSLSLSLCLALCLCLCLRLCLCLSLCVCVHLTLCLIEARLGRQQPRWHWLRRLALAMRLAE